MSFSLTPTSGGRLRRSIRQNDQVRRRFLSQLQTAKGNGNNLPVIPNAATSSLATHTLAWSMATSPNRNPVVGDGSSSTGYCAASTLSELPSKQTTRPSHRYQLRSCPPSGPLTPWTMTLGEEMDFTMAIDDNNREEEEATSSNETPPEIKRLETEIKTKDRTIKSLQRKLDAAEKFKARYEAAKRQRKRDQENQQARWAELQTSLLGFG